MKKWILAVLILIFILAPVPLVIHYDCKVNCGRGKLCECPKLPLGTRNLWDGYFLTWQKSLGQKAFEFISSYIFCLQNQCATVLKY